MKKRKRCPFLIMATKFSLYALLACFINPVFGFTANGQTLDGTKITFSVENSTVVEILHSIEAQTPFRFLYDSNISKLGGKYSYHTVNISVREALRMLSKDARLRFQQVNNSISVTKVPPALKKIVMPIYREISGKVTDSNNEPLPGASISVKGTNVGTTADLDGTFTLEIPENSAFLVVSYLGFRTVEVPVGEQNEYHFALQEDSSRLDEVVVVGYRQSLDEALNIKKDNINTVDAVVAEDIAKFPQSNMAEALQRISGIQIRRDNAGGVGNEVSVRGLPPEYTQVTINGDAVPNSTEGRNYDFNTLPAEIFSKVEVTKTPTASIPEGGIGGSVNLVTKKPFELKGEILVASAEGVYNTQQQQGNRMTPKVSLTYGNKWNDKFGIIAGIFYNKFFNTSEGYDVTRYYLESYDLDNDGVNEYENIRVPRPRYISEGQEVVRLSLNLGLQYQVNEDFDLVFEGLFVNNDQTATRYTPIWFMPGSAPTEVIANGPFVESITYDNITGTLENQQQANITKNYNWSIRGKYNLHQGWKLGAKFVHAFNKRDSERFRYYAESVNTVTYSVEDDLQFFELRTPTNFSNADEFRLTQARRYLWDFGDEIFTGKLDLSKRFYNKIDIEFGGSFRDRTKTQEYFFRTDDTLNDPFAPIALLLTDFLDNVDRAKGFNEFLVPDFDQAYDMYGSQLNLEDFEVIDAAYDINEKIAAGYLQANYSNKSFDANAGLRIVSTDITSRGYQLDNATQIYEVREIKSNYIDYLPSINLKWEFARGVFARGGFARVITRPSLQDLSSFRIIDDVNQRITANNPDLDPFRATQYDISMEWYPIPETLISAAFFIKDIESFISTQTTLVPFNGAQYELRQPVNGNDATLRGFEVNYQQPFTFLPSPFDGLGIVANYTFSESDFREELEDGSSTAYPLPNNSKHTFNITPYYEKYGFSLRVATNFRSSFLREIPNPEDGLKYRDDVSITDISTSYDINKNFGVTLNILNAFNSKRYEYIFEEQYMDNVSFFGTTFQLGLRAKF